MACRMYVSERENNSCTPEPIEPVSAFRCRRRRTRKADQSQLFAAGFLAVCRCADVQMWERVRNEHCQAVPPKYKILRRAMVPPSLGLIGWDVRGQGYPCLCMGQMGPNPHTLVRTLERFEPRPADVRDKIICTLILLGSPKSVQNFLRQPCTMLLHYVVCRKGQGPAHGPSGNPSLFSLRKCGTATHRRWRRKRSGKAWLKLKHHLRDGEFLIHEPRYVRINFAVSHHISVSTFGHDCVNVYLSFPLLRTVAYLSPTSR
ncbi:hypothetical protein GGR53DRAFT_63885 [Hypoxylon sp. FL1150]|nr:hypothetical protein GGR53DRAFT_63885 [Hypoxylon sp. FL1150]